METTGAGGIGSCELAREPSLDIGVVDGAGEYQFFRVSDATLLADHRIAVMNAGTHEMRVYGPDGRFLHAFGREGDGPGEFRLAAQLWQRADSLVVYDARQQRLSWFSLDGTFIRDVALRPVYLNGPRLFFLADGRMIAVDHVFTVPASGFLEQPLYVILHEANGQAADTLGRFAFGRLGPVGPPGAAMVSGPIFGHRTRVAASGERVYVGRGVAREVEVLRPDGSLAELIRWTGPDRSVTDEDLRRFQEAELAGAETQAERAAVRQRLEQRPVAERFPAVGELRVDRVGRLWIREYPRPSWNRSQRWSVLDEQGALVCRLHVPERFDVAEIGLDYMLGVWRDALEVEHIRLYDLAVQAGGATWIGPTMHPEEVT